MSKLDILTPRERKEYEKPPIFSTNAERANYFQLDDNLQRHIRKLHQFGNRIGFVLQVGYFKRTGRFFPAKTFMNKDISFVAKLLNLPIDAFNKVDYASNSFYRHQQKILDHLGHHKFDKCLFDQEVTRLTRKYVRPKQIVIAIIEHFRKAKTELPSYPVFQEAISAEYYKLEEQYIKVFKKHLSTEGLGSLQALLPSSTTSKINSEPNKFYHRSDLTALRAIKQSLRVKNIKENVGIFLRLKALYGKFQSIISKAELSSEAIQYYGIWVFKARTHQVAQFKCAHKRALYLICFITHQYYMVHDILVDIFLRATQAVTNNITQQLKESAFENRQSKHQAIHKLTQYVHKSKDILQEIKSVIYAKALTDKGKVSKIQTLIESNMTDFDEAYEQELQHLELEAQKVIHGHDYYDVLEKQSTSLQLKVSEILKHLSINASSSDNNLSKAIYYYAQHNGRIKDDAPITFLTQEELPFIIDDEGKLKVSLYKALLFLHVAEGVKSGTINLQHSYRYLSIDEYLIDNTRWEKEKEDLLERAGMTHLSSIDDVLKTLKLKLNDNYIKTNDNILLKRNPYIRFKENGDYTVNTPAVEKLETSRVSELFEQCKYTPILQILESIDQITGYADALKHYTIKYTKQRPESRVFYAGLIGMGCNIGIRKIANVSVGVKESTLVNAFNWYFSIDNLNAANNKIINVINKLSLPEVFVRQKRLLHASADGKKVNVNADSLNANYSFKYHGSGQGASVYTFIDERHVLFHSMVISSSEREAGYVIDGTLHNEEVRSDILSTDTHGFTEVVFGITHLLGISFAPRIKKPQNQLLYSFEKIKRYQNKNYKILPDRYISQALIEDNWDDVLRLMVTIKLKEATASQILKRLSSYAKQNPLYRAVKEFGRIIKSDFLLTYFDDLKLRQMIQKQLNKVELCNKFSSAVFFANNQEFNFTTKEEQEIAMHCKRLIQNAIILWNYLYLSKLLDEADSTEKAELLEVIRQGSILIWQHINLHGEYDFTKKAANADSFFDMEKLLMLKVS